jgi:hypothetical protein
VCQCDCVSVLSVCQCDCVSVLSVCQWCLCVSVIVCQCCLCVSMVCVSVWLCVSVTVCSLLKVMMQKCLKCLHRTMKRIRREKHSTKISCNLLWGLRYSGIRLYTETTDPATLCTREWRFRCVYPTEVDGIVCCSRRKK